MAEFTPSRARSAVASGIVALVCSAAVAGLTARTPQGPAVSLEDLLARAGTYLDGYQKQFAAVVSEETYTQQIQGVGTQVWNTPIHRVTRSDVLMLNLGANQWMGFRDVFDVNGRAIRDHVQRLQKLMLDTPGQLIERASALSAESARFNLGSVERTINLPAVGLEYLDRANQSRSTFRLRGDERVGDATAAVLEFSEEATPTIVRDSKDGNQAATGRFWLDPATGRVLRNELRFDTGGMQVAVTVTYAPNAKLGMWVPATMNERYELGGRSEIITAKAVYSNFRKFTVDVSAIKHASATN
jgi:hypothetical protein